MKRFDDAQRIRKRALLFATALTIPAQYWVASTWNGFSLTSLFINAAAITALLSGASLLLARIDTRLAFRPGELLLVYMMISVATGAAGNDTLIMLTQVIGYPTHFSSPENEWEELFGNYLPRWLLVNDPDIVEGMYRHGFTVFDGKVIRVVLRPVLFWTLFLSVLYFAMACLSIIFRKQWVERERLAFPVAQIPLGILNPRTAVYRERRFWVGFFLTAGLSLVNGLHRLIPAVPGIFYGKYRLGALFREAPWNAVGTVYVEFLPFVIGISFFIPVSLSFSIWFFYWFWKLVNVFGRMVGLHRLPGFPGYWMQGSGGVAMMTLLFLFWSRRHLADVLRIVFRTATRRDPNDDSPYAFAFWGFVLSFLFLVGFLYVAGMALWVGLLFIGGFFSFAFVTTRLRAQLGPPTHEIPFTTSGFLLNVIGLKRIDGRSLTQIAVFKFVDFGQRGTPMPHMLESLYLKGRLGVRQPAMFVTGLLLAIVIGSFVGFVGNMERNYRDTVMTWVGRWAFPQLASQLQYHIGTTNPVYVVYFLIGAAVVYVLGLMSRLYVWWPFHPLGYIMGSEWMLRHLWFPIFLAWAIRWTLLRFGGMAAHRKAIPFFIGVTLGDAIMLTFWSVYGAVFNRWTLKFVYW